MKGELKGLSAILRNYKIYSQKLKQDLLYEVQRAALSVERKAKSRVVVDTGKLKQSIYSKMDFRKGTALIGATESYAPYVEFGTGGLVSVPNGYDTFANQFKGKGLKKINRRPKPFLIPSFLEEQQIFKGNVRVILNKYSGLKSIKRL